jgi:lipooligosaccharide transport system permease protein
MVIDEVSSGGAHGVDLATLAAAETVTFGLAAPASVQARRARLWGWWYYVEYRLISMRAYWLTIVGYGVLAPILYLAAMGLGLGSLVDNHVGTVASVSYLAFVGPSLLVTTVVQECTAEFTYTVMGNFVWHRTYYGVAASPVSPRQIAIGELVAVGLRLALQAGVFWVILVISGATASGWSWLMVPIAVVAALSFGAPLLAFSATRERDDFSFSFIQRFIVMPMFLFAGTFFPLESMPGYLQWIGWISPMWHGTQLARAASFGLPLSTVQILLHLGFLVALIVIGVWLALNQFSRRLTR